jgi:hypothetical protein
VVLRKPHSLKVEKTVAWQFENAKSVLLETLTGAWDGLTFRSDKLSYPLQAADLIAWQRHRRDMDLPEDRGPRLEWKKLNLIFTPGRSPPRFAANGFAPRTRSYHSYIA